jgi:hypothetical protein
MVGGPPQKMIKLLFTKVIFSPVPDSERIDGRGERRGERGGGRGEGRGERGEGRRERGEGRGEKGEGRGSSNVYSHF